MRLRRTVQNVSAVAAEGRGRLQTGARRSAQPARPAPRARRARVRLRFAARRGPALLVACALALAAACGAWAQAAAAPAPAQAAPLSLEDAVQQALEKDHGVQSANWDWLTATAKVDAARWRMVPGLSFSAAYQHLSELPATSIDMADPFAGVFPTAPATISFSFPESLNDIWTFALNMQYPVFAGFRVLEAQAMAKVQAQSKLVALEMVKRSLVFEVRRAYWEAVRATLNRQTLQKNLELMKAGAELTAKQVSQGTATRADQLAADMRSTQADLDLGDAISQQNRAFLVLSSLVGNVSVPLALSPQAADAPAPFTLTTGPGDTVLPEVGEKLVDNDLVSRAIASRPETRASALAIQAAEHGIRQAEAGLYPTVMLLGNYTLADPNQRVAFQTDPNLFTGTWALGIQLNYDIGGLPTTLAERAAQAQALKKSKADAEKQASAVILDVRSCIISLERTRRDVALTRGSVDQATENLRVARQRLSAGTASDLDVLTSEFNLLKANFAVTNRQIDAQIATADLARAIALDTMR